MQPGEPRIVNHELQQVTRRTHTAAIQLVGRARVVEQRLVQREQPRAKLRETRPRVAPDSASAFPAAAALRLPRRGFGKQGANIETLRRHL